MQWYVERYHAWLSTPFVYEKELEKYTVIIIVKAETIFMMTSHLVRYPRYPLSIKEMYLQHVPLYYIQQSLK